VISAFETTEPDVSGYLWISLPPLGAFEAILIEP
jgi:hypothetical protein